MKIVALITFKNESSNLYNCLKSISGVVESILGYDDSSSDDSSSIFQSMGGNLVGADLGLKFVNGQEREIRSALLLEGQKIKGTHFLFIDADEVFSDTLRIHFRQYCAMLIPGQKLNINWVNLGLNGLSYYPVGGEFQPMQKDFVVMDANGLGYNGDSSQILHFGRTPSGNTLVEPITLPPIHGAVLHSQHLDRDLYALKQVKYKCLELAKTRISPYQINENTRFTLSDSSAVIPVPGEYRCEQFAFAANEVALNETLLEIFVLFKEFGILYFEKLEIWHIGLLKEHFINLTGRLPKSYKVAKFFRRARFKARVIKNAILSRS
jgi:hypothetical protein